MENVKEIIGKNLAQLRKDSKMTQSTLAEKLNYSDKAISRWEHGETLPDIETLCRVCDIFGVKFEYLLQAEQPKTANPYIKNSSKPRQVIICLTAICTVWLAALVLFTLIRSKWGMNIWQLFIWAMPVSATVAGLCNLTWWRSKVWSILIRSFGNWTLILSLYLQLLSSDLWTLFIIGIPIQAIIILIGTMPKKTK